MKITAKVTIHLERADGTETTVTEAASDNVGDNARFEKAEAVRLIAAVGSYVTDKIQGVEPGHLESRRVIRAGL